MTAVGLAASAACVAGPFCVVVTGLGQDCKYYDEGSCAQAAMERHGACVDRSTGLATGFNRGARYCLVGAGESRSEEHTSELQSQSNLVCRLLLEKKKWWIVDDNVDWVRSRRYAGIICDDG